jgi:molybdopterin-biosynthesis enzyme MoeA-like protein
MMMELNGKLCYSLPGVPYEVKPLIKDQIIPYLQEKFSLNYIIQELFLLLEFRKYSCRYD